MKIWKYKNYEEYVEAQTRANVKKINLKWVEESTIAKIHSWVPFATSILCHGTRNAAEQKFFKKYYSHANIVGTEISHTAKNFPMTVQHDFHEVKDEWISKFDILYTNSFDHSYDPIKCLNTWKNQLSDNGIMFVEHAHSEVNNRSRAIDPLEISIEELLELLKEVGLNAIIKDNTGKGATLYQVNK